MSKIISRRQFIKVSAVGITVVGTAAVVSKVISKSSTDLPNPYPVLPEQKPAIPSPSTSPLFFNNHQYSLVASIAALIIPTDEYPGASEAGVADYIDKLVAGSVSKQKVYKNGLKWIDNVSRNLYGLDFLSLSIKNQIELLMLVEETESKVNRPVSSFIERLDRKVDDIMNKLFGIGDGPYFFNKIRTDSFYGYYSNPVSWKVVGYYGPPQPIGYPDYAKPPSSVKYRDSVRPINNTTCQNCHFDQLEKEDHKDEDNCMECHEPHSPIKEYIKNG